MVETKARIYMASPLGFSEAGRHFYHSVLVPFVSTMERFEHSRTSRSSPSSVHAVGPNVPARLVPGEVASGTGLDAEGEPESGSGTG